MARVSKPDGDDGCWLVERNHNNMGYAQMWGTGGQEFCHRVSYKLFVGPIPEGKVLDHLCRVRHCCNPAHLQAVTQQQNVEREDFTPSIEASRRRSAAITHCKHGHPYDEANTLYQKGRNGMQRTCRTCRNARYAKAS